ncbi:alpha-D-ribose 1-methylphosphonate 5-triphosphate diphosphatase [Rhizobium mongolense]|uniref:Alpha-D-ribose 1-methylphosphonate 5-triphosphate diphosphatase n=2 Tax=Rhizobium mongolense TaxID=57676 RepID=A0ABR6IX78_9HYPH|nr:alpha-D-ribose 1-methylphosphonate 5-triphosphate diphosphatase [Rhizobium mongolense]MBB4232526.1 alpha-D-ribose 1-methylphosphonate 5-triphosphate diphosphatase [Rhizobium mongolense]TVZ75035.1 alpha-D-ribose 1-methylphosphonate 5-triphosphate diphosphatase [Rhizobium mongolense USDA 1844]
MATESVITGTKIILPGEIIAEGSVHITDGLISDISFGRSNVPNAINLDSGYLAPGLIDLHTDNLEKHALPRPGVRWDALSATVAHDAVIAAAGITTVFDSLCIGSTTRAMGRSDDDRSAIVPTLIDSIGVAKSRGLLRSDHFLHLRCEVTDADVIHQFEPLADNPLLRLISVMDHAPGYRQSADLDRFREMQIARYGWTAADADRHIEEWMDASKTVGPKNQDRIVSLARSRNLPVASHDDETAEHVHDAHRTGVKISEFPTTPVAAATARGVGIQIVMGAPNVVRGSSHSGNVSARDLAIADHLDILASDYVPASLLHAAFQLSKDPVGMPLWKAVATVSSTPANICGLSDRGAIKAGLRADLCHFVEIDDKPVVTRTWSNGRAVF